MLKSKLNLAAAGVVAATLSMQSMASEVATAQAPLSVDELSFAFADVAQADVLAMSQGEMKETEGAWIPLAAAGLGAFLRSPAFRHVVKNGNLGATAGFLQQGGQQIGQGNFNGRELVIATGAGWAGGAVGGGLRPTSTFSSLQTPSGLRPAMIGGTVSGVATGLINRASTPTTNQPNVQINHNTHQLNQQMLNQNLYGDFQRFANTQQNFQMPRLCVQVVTASGFSSGFSC